MIVPSAPRILPTPISPSWPIAVLVIVVVIVVPAGMLNQVLAGLSALLMGAAVPAVKYRNRQD